MTDFKYLAHHPVKRAKLANLTIRDAEWTDTLNGGSVLTGKVTVPEDLFQAARIEEGTRPDEAAIYVQSAPGVITWGGIVKKRTWDSETNTLTLSVQEWRTWLYTAILGPKADGSGSNIRTWTGVDQLTIARQILGIVTAEGTAGGVPIITTGTETSGVNRNYGLTGMAFKSVGTYLDELASMDGGFEWDVEFYFGDDGLPTLRLATYYPQRGGEVPGLLFKEGFNILAKDELQMSSETRATRVWGVGEGPNAESTPYAMDQDPALSSGYVLRTDAAITFPGVSRTTLASYARSSRGYLGLPLSQFTFTVSTDSPPFNSYQAGDRCRIVLRDRFTSLDVSKVRILSREIDAENQLMKLTVNFNDVVVPEIDLGGSV